MKELYLHIGQHKTGSTALQVFWDTNRDLLQKKGIYYPLLDSKKGEYANGNARYMTFVEKNIDQFGEGDWAYIEKLKVIVDSHEKVLLSCEDFWHTQIQKVVSNLKNLLELDDNGIKIIVYIRRQDEKIESHWKHRIAYRSSTSHMTCWEFAEQNALKPNAANDYYNVLHNASLAVGDDNMFVRIYDSRRFAREGNGLFKDFLSIFGIEDISGFQMPAKKANVSLNENMTEIKRVLNTIPKTVTLSQEYLDIRRSDAMRKIEREESPFLTYGQRKEILDYYEEDNKKIGREFFGINASPFPPLERSENKDITQETTGGGTHSCVTLSVS